MVYEHVIDALLHLFLAVSVPGVRACERVSACVCMCVCVFDVFNVCIVSYMKNVKNKMKKMKNAWTFSFGHTYGLKNPWSNKF